MKVFSALFFFLSILVFLPLFRRFVADRTLQYFATWLMALTMTPFYETFNGMEMNLALFLFLFLVYILTSNFDRWIQFLSAWIVASLFLATRFEAPFALAALLIGCALGRNSRPKCPKLSFLVALSVACCGSFLGLELWRRQKFGLWMPNTIYAKLWWPYQPQYQSLRGLITNRAHATMEVAVVLLAPLLVTLIVSARSWTRNRPTITVHPIIGSLALATILFGLIFGKNLGHRGRMTEYLMPFALLFLIVILIRVSRTRSHMWAALLTIGVIHLALWSTLVYRLTYRGDSVPIAKYEKEGLAAEVVRSALHRDSLTILIPDVGGASLCCNKLRILDIALLTNPELAREGYTQLGEYFTSNRPDIVVVAEGWSIASGIYNKGLLDRYSMVQVHDSRLFVRNDLYAQLLSLNIGRVKAIGDLPTCLGTTNEDKEYSKLKEVCLDFPE
jgi:hypothetical protein